jgi:hypothetical protein
LSAGGAEEKAPSTGNNAAAEHAQKQSGGEVLLLYQCTYSSSRMTRAFESIATRIIASSSAGNQQLEGVGV